MTVLLVLGLFLGFLAIDAAVRARPSDRAPDPGAPELPGGSFLSKGLGSGSSLGARCGWAWTPSPRWPPVPSAG